jgi:hypothetical protein
VQPFAQRVVSINIPHWTLPDTPFADASPRASSKSINPGASATPVSAAAAPMNLRRGSVSWFDFLSQRDRSVIAASSPTLNRPRALLSLPQARQPSLAVSNGTRNNQA